MLVSFKTNFRLYLLVTSMLLAGCISIQSTAPEDRTSQVHNQSLDEIQSLKEEVKSLRELLAKGSKEGIEQINPRSTNEDLNYELIERVLRETSEVASQPEVVFVRPAEVNPLQLLEYHIPRGRRAGSKGFAFFEENFGDTFKLYREAAENSCRKRGHEFLLVKESADSSGDFGSQVFVFGCLDSSQRDYQRIGRSETIFFLDSGIGMGYTEISPFPPASYSVLRPKILEHTY